MGEMSAHILIVDDDKRLRDLLRDFLGRMGYRITTADCAADAEAKMQGLVFDLMVLDVMMPGETGVDFVRRLRDQGDVTLPILMLTAMGEAEDRIRGFEGGVDDYLVKPFEPRELVLRIEAILRRVASVPTDMDIEPLTTIRMGCFEFDMERRIMTCDGDPVKLTSAEIQLLSILAERAGETISRQQLSDLVSASSERAVDVQVTRLRKKIEEDPKAPRYLQTVWGEGYILMPDDPVY